MCLRVSDKSSPPPPPHTTFPPTPHPKNNHTVIRRQCYETFQASCNVPSIVRPANYLAKSQHLLNVHHLQVTRENLEHSVKTSSKSDLKSSEPSIKGVSQAARESSEFSITRCYKCVLNSYHPNHTVIRQCAYVCRTKVSCAHFLSCPLTDPPHFISFLFVSCVRPGCLTRELVG